MFDAFRYIFLSMMSNYRAFSYFQFTVRLLKLNSIKFTHLSLIKITIFVPVQYVVAIYVCARREKIFRIFLHACESSCKNCLDGQLVIKTERPKQKTNVFFRIIFRDGLGKIMCTLTLTCVHIENFLNQFSRGL